MVKLIGILVLGWALDGTAWARGGGGGHGGGGHWGGGGGHYGGGHWGGGYRGGGYWGHGYYGGRPFRGYSSFGFYFGPGWGWPYPGPYYYPYYAYPPAIVAVPAEPPVYIERGAAGSAGPRPWHYCPDPPGYAPYVKDCPAGWQAIAPAPMGQEPGYWYRCDDPRGRYPYVRDCPSGWRKAIPEPAATNPAPNPNPMEPP